MRLKSPIMLFLFVCLFLNTSRAEKDVTPPINLLGKPLVFLSAFVVNTQPFEEHQISAISLMDVSDKEFIARLFSTGLKEGLLPRGELDAAIPQAMFSSVATWSRLPKEQKLYLSGLWVYLKMGEQGDTSLSHFRIRTLMMLTCAQAHNMFINDIITNQRINSPDTVENGFQYCSLESRLLR